jgi:FkbM family methyltransferase
LKKRAFGTVIDDTGMVMHTSQPLKITVEGNAVHVRRGLNDGFWSDYDRGIWEPSTEAAFRQFIDKQHSYIDIGAWIGPTLLLGCQLAKRAYGVEPDPIAYAELIENIECNRPLTNNVQIFNICIAPVSGKVSLGNRGRGGDSMSSLLFSREKTTWTVDGMNLEDWIRQREIDDCNFIKIDIEGAEYRVLPTMTAYLRDHRPTLHLSLHPCFIGEQEVQGVSAKLERSLLRLENTFTILRILRFYKHLYDPTGKVPILGMSPLRSRLRHALAKLSWRPGILLLTYINSLRGIPSSLLLTDQEWQVNAESLSRRPNEQIFPA